MKSHTSNKEVVLGVTGSIAAYKACEIASRLVELGARVQPVLTKSGAKMLGSASLEAICGRRAVLEMFEPVQNPEIEHIAVARRADLFLIAPASANILAKAAIGLADDWLSTTLLATRAPILFAPAMNTNMYEHPATRQNIETLKSRGCHFVGPGEGRLACRTIGPGRMIDPAAIIEAALPLLSGRSELKGKRVLITSGGTREPLDPVRYLGNRSSGKMGRALALEAAAFGAAVTVIAGPSEVGLPEGVEIVHVETAEEMAKAVFERLDQSDIFIAAAAVADYSIKTPSVTKEKRTGKPITLDLVENPDILAEAGKRRGPGQVLIGFAAETNDLIANGRAKLEKKQVDLIVANLVGAVDSGFGLDTLTASLIEKSGNEPVPRQYTKDELAHAVMWRAVELAARIIE